VLAIWARLALGGNWSSDVTVKMGHTLMTSGPYAYVRHPIYSGLLLTVLGTAIVFGEARCFLAFVLMLTGFWIKFHAEENFMEEEFGQQYSNYKQRVKALIPHVI
ncbi:MAG TPA: isoprenylcysteine carboxylmethyltransferase family protein, partial [Acidobacteriaceae bacterium]|nr:isoprenylcysteine carboxylmethyltransferase family protein [Acidobacteriaceae bacterium]